MFLNNIFYLMKQGSDGARNVGLEPYSEMYVNEVAAALCRRNRIIFSQIS